MNRIKKKIKSLSLRQRLIISTILCVLLPSIITFMVASYITRDTLEEKAVKQSAENLRLLDLNISDYLEDMVYISNYIQFDHNLNTLVKESSHNNIDNQSHALLYTEIKKELEGITDLLTPVYITILMKNGFNYTNYSTYQYDPNEFYEMEWFQEIKHLNFYQTYWIGTHPANLEPQKNGSSYLISFAKAIKEKDHTYAYTIISINEKKIGNLLKG